MLDKIFAAIATVLLVLVIGTIGYVELAPSKITVVVQLKEDADPFVTLRTIVPSNSAVTSIKEINHSKHEYEMTVKTHQKQAMVVEWMQNQEKVKKVELRNR